jgi:hypothetical protein
MNLIEGAEEKVPLLIYFDSLPTNFQGSEYDPHTKTHVFSMKFPPEAIEIRTKFVGGTNEFSLWNPAMFLGILKSDASALLRGEWSNGLAQFLRRWAKLRYKKHLLCAIADGWSTPILSSDTT